MYEHVGATRTAEGLKMGLKKLQRLDEYVEHLKAQDYHELMRVYEARSLLEIAKVMAQTALYREESRNKPYHYRLDFPETDDEHWCGLVVIRKLDERLGLSFERLSYP